MKKHTLFLTVFLFIAMFLASCGPASETDRTPGATDDFDLTGEPTDMMTEVSGEPTEPMTDTVTTEPTAMMTTEATTTPAASPTGDVTEAATSEATEVLPPTGFVDYHRVSNLLDLAVYTQDGEQIGEVGDLVIDPQNQQVEYVILQLGGFLGLGESQVPVPWGAINVLGVEDRSDDMNDNSANTNDNTTDDSNTNDNGNTNDNLNDDDDAFDEDIESGLVLLVSQDVAENAPDMDLALFDTFCGVTAGWDADIQTYWSTNMPLQSEDNGTDTTPVPATTPAPGDATATPGTDVATATPGPDTGTPAGPAGVMQGMILATDLLGADILAQDNQDEVGTVDDIIIDTDSGDIRFLVVGFSFDDVDSRIPLPVALLGCNADNQTYVVLIDTATVRGAPTFTNNEFPDTRTSDWDANFLDYWDDFVDMDMNDNTTP